MESIKDTIALVMKQLGKGENRLLVNSPEDVIKKHLTKKEIKHIKVKYFRKGVLGVAVDSSVWMYHLNLQRHQLVEKLHKDCADIKDIRLFVGDMT